MSVEALRAALIVPGGLWQDIRVVAETESTNTDLLADARLGRAEGSVLAAENQSAGRGRMGRRWVSPPRAALMFSALLRPAAVPQARRGWLPLLTGVAVASALRAEASRRCLAEVAQRRAGQRREAGRHPRRAGR